jgi:hypothetical protein
MEFEKPVLREPIRAGTLNDLSNYIFDFGPFTKEGIAPRIITKNADFVEIRFEDVFAGGMNFEKPVLWQPLNAGGMYAIPLGTRPPFPGDTMHLIDFADETGHDLFFTVGSGAVMVLIGSQHAKILGYVEATGAGNFLSVIEFAKHGLFGDYIK